MNDRELGTQLGNVLNYGGRIEGRFQAMRDYLHMEDEHPFTANFFDDQQRDLDELEAAARKCMTAISGPLELHEIHEPHERDEDGEPGGDEYDEDGDDEDGEWEDV